MNENDTHEYADDCFDQWPTSANAADNCTTLDELVDLGAARATAAFTEASMYAAVDCWIRFPLASWFNSTGRALYGIKG